MISIYLCNRNFDLVKVVCFIFIFCNFFVFFVVNALAFFKMRVLASCAKGESGCCCVKISSVDLITHSFNMLTSTDKCYELQCFLLIHSKQRSILGVVYRSTAFLWALQEPPLINQLLFYSCYCFHFT